MGTAFTAVANDVSALYYNPAGIGFFQGTQLQMDTVVIAGVFHFVPSSMPPGTIVPEDGFNGLNRLKYQPVGSLFASHQLSSKLTLGFGMFMPFGLSGNFTNFNDSDPAQIKYVGRFAGTRDRMECMWFQPTIAYRIMPDASVAIGVALVKNHILLEQSFLNPLDDGLDFGRSAASQIFPGMDKDQAARAIARLLPEGRARIAGTSSSPGVTVGYLYKHPRWKTNFGLMYRSAVTHHFSGKASFAFTRGSTLEQFLGIDVFEKAFPAQNIKASMTTPATYAIGIAHSSFWNSTISFDFRIQDYRRFRDVPINFTVTPQTNSDAVTPAERRLAFDFRDSYNVAAGFEKPLGRKTVIRAGYLYDRTPVVDKSVGPLFPDSSRHKITAGLTRVMGSKELSIFYDFTQFVNRTTNVPNNDKQWTNGNYNNYAQLVGVSFRFLFGGTGGP